MRRDKLFGNKFMRFAACTLMAFACAGEAWGRSISKPNPEFLRWQKEKNFQGVITNVAKSSVKNQQKRMRLQSSPLVEEEIRIPDDERPLGYMPTVIDKSYLGDLNVANSRSVQVSMGLSISLPPAYDLRDYSRVTPVKNQGSYGTCWSHATMASCESWLLYHDGTIYDLSEKQLAQNHDWDMGYEGFTAGGNGDIAASFLTQWRGPMLETQDPYPSDSYYDKWYTDYTNGVLYELNSILPKSPNSTSIGHVQQIRWIPAMHYSTNSETVKNELIPIKQALMKHGVLYVNYFHCISFYKDFDGKYKVESKPREDGYYYYADNSWMDTYYFPYDRNQYEVYGHAVAIIGWDDNFSKSNFKVTPPGNGAFIVKNSWGTTFGMDGYFYVSYYDRYFAKNELVSFSDVEPVNNYSSIYQYDPMGNVRPWSPVSGGGEIAWGANMFTATNSEPLAAVGFYAFAPNTSYQIKIYVGCEVGKPISGSVKLTQDGTTDYAGYVTVPLSQTINVGNGKRFSIVLKLMTPGIDEPLALEGYYYSNNRAAMANEGESFASEDGKTWADLTKIRMDYGSGTYNFCCKAYTVGKAEITLSSIEIDGLQSITSGQKAQFSCKALYSDGSKKTIYPAWSITEGRNYATISSAGLVTAKSVTTQQRVTVKASYTEDDVTKEDTWGFFVTIAAPDIPTGVMATQGAETSCIRVNWTAPSGATEYAVYRATANNSKNAQYLENVTVARYNDTSAISGVDYWYFIKAKNSSGTSGFSAGMLGWRKLSPPDAETIKASDNLTDRVTISWGEVEGATHYRVYRADKIDGEKTPLGGWQTARTFDDVPPEKDVPYYYYVVAAVDASGNRPSDYSIVEDGMMVSPVTVDHLEIKGDASVASGGYADYTADAIYTDRHRVENVSPVTWTVSGDGATVSGNRVTAATVTENKKVVLLASYTENGKIARGEKEITIAAVKPNAPTGVTADSTSQGVTITWNAVSGAVSYKVYRVDSANAVATQIGMTAGTSYPDTSAIPGVAYTYSVSAVNGAGESERSGGVVVTVPLAAPTGVKASTDDATAVRISWVGVNGATYYRVARAPSAEGEKVELGTWQVGAAYSDTTATLGTEYYYFVRASIDSSASVVSAWSDGVIGKILYEAPTLQTLVIGGPERIAASGTGAYSCTALYSDGNKENVSPDWSLSSTSAATIDSSGVISAKAVTSDAKVTLTASYGGLQTSREVVIVVPLAEASATVSNISVAPRWPFSTKVDIDYTLDTSPSGTRAFVTLSGYDNDHRKEMPATTIAGDSANQAVLAGRHRLTWDVGADYPGFHAKSFDVNLKAEPYVIPSVTGIQTGETSTRGVLLSWEGVEIATAYEVWRSTSMSVNNATNVFSVTNATECLDSSAIPGTIYFYWLKTVTPYGTGDFSSEYAFGYRQKVSVAVTFDANGGTLSGASTSSYTAGDQYKSLPSPTRTGYDFAGWWTLTSAGVQVGATSVVDENITTLYAHWTPHTYTIHFDPNGGFGTMNDMPMVYDVSATLAPNAFNNDGWTFVGWATSIGGAVEYVERESISNLSSEDGVTIMLYATWEQMPTWVITDGVLESVFLNGVRDVEIPSSVSNIGEKVFSDCYDLETVIIPNSVTNISDRAFYNCTSLKSAIVPNSVERIGKYAFSGCKELSAVNIPTKVKMIEWGAFDFCSSLTDVIIPNGVTNIQALAFYRCNLKNINVPQSVLHIGTDAFAYCEELEYLSLTEGIQSVDSRAFEGCASLKSVTLPNSLCNVSEGMFSSCRNLANVVIGTGVTSIGDGAFSGCGLTSLSIPENVKTIGASAFAYCDGLKTVTVSKGVTTIENTTYNNLFDNCANLENINVDINNSSFTSVSGVLYNKDKTRLIRVPEGKAISQFTVPSSVEIIQNGAFRNCNKITKVIMQSGVWSIGDSVFNNASQLRTITIPSSVRQIGSHAFSYCSNLTTINVDDANSRFASDGGVLYDKSKTKIVACPGGSTYVVIPNGVTTIASYAFCGCNKLTGVSMPTSVINIAGYAFRDCSALTDFSWPKTVERITIGVFLGCNSLRTMSIPNTVTGVDLGAFQNCSNLVEITVPNSVKYINSDAFKNCVSLSSLTLGTGITSIGSSAFEGCRSLKQVTIPKNVESIGYRAFQGCDNLYRAIIGCRSIDAAFYGCSNLVNVVINDGVENIGSSTFADCVRLTDITLPMSVTNINATAFSACESLTNINAPSESKRTFRK